MANHLFGFVFGCLLTVASTSNLVYQTVDTRYPAYIINDPRVKCPEAGSFPHPADCSWFYRCVDRSGVGAFHVYFFQCEPGTIFLDELDQCVFGSKTAPPCVSTGVSVKPLPPLPVPFPPPTEAAPPPPSPQTTKSPIITTLLPTNPPTSPEPSTPPVTFATTLPSTPVPPAPETTVKTTATPSVSSPLAPAPPPTTESTVTVTETSQNPDTVQESTTQCTNCVSTPICKVGEKPYFEELCESCSFANGNFVTPEVECPYHPDPHLTSEGRCLAGNQICPLLRQEQQEKRQETFTIQCSDFKTRPDEPQIRSLFCKNYHYCSPFGSYLKTQTLCSNYFQCYKSWNGAWSTEMRNCTEQNLYSFELDQCLPEPKAVELCSRK